MSASISSHKSLFIPSENVVSYSLTLISRFKNLTSMHCYLNLYLTSSKCSFSPNGKGTTGKLCHDESDQRMKKKTHYVKLLGWQQGDSNIRWSGDLGH